MPRQKHYYGQNRLPFLTRSTYRRVRLLDSERFKLRWVRTLEELRRELDFKIIGYVLMPEHFHLLLWPSADANPSQILQKLEDRTALFVLKNLKENSAHPWCRKMLARLALPPTVHDESWVAHTSRCERCVRFLGASGHLRKKVHGRQGCICGAGPDAGGAYIAVFAMCAVDGAGTQQVATVSAFLTVGF